MEVQSRRTEQTEATRRALLDSARGLFAERGYAGVGTEEIVRRARVTRGALYHHFRGKDDLFGAVFEELNREITERVAKVAMAQEDPWEKMRAGSEAFLDACREPAVQRIVLLDAPSVLGWETWRAIDEQAGLGLVEAVLAEAVEAGVIERQPLRPLAHLLLGALHEGAMVIARSEDAAAAREEVGASFGRVLAGLRSGG
jgi:AcrR family transcriptional regulator